MVEETELQWLTKKCEECSAGAIKSVDFCIICLSCSVGDFNMSTRWKGDLLCQDSRVTVGHL